MNRARATQYGKQLDHLSEFNHLYEMAIFSYYKREYAQATLCLLTALEGVMLSFYGYSINSAISKPNIPELINKIEAASAPTYPGSQDQLLQTAHDMYRDTLVRLLKEWIYKKTIQSDFSLSVLNRHYILHGMDAGDFYRPQDIRRLILAFDLLIEFLSFQQDVFHSLLPSPGEDSFFDARKAYYEALSAGVPTVAESWDIERSLLRQHKRYVAPAHDPRLFEAMTLPPELKKELEQMPPELIQKLERLTSMAARAPKAAPPEADEQ